MELKKDGRLHTSWVTVRKSAAHADKPTVGQHDEAVCKPQA